MNRAALPSTTLTLIAAVALAWVLAITGPGLDMGPDDAGNEWAQAEVLQQLQETAALRARLEHAAAVLCVAEGTPDGAHAWTPEGQLVCAGTPGRSATSQAAAL